MNNMAHNILCPALRSRWILLLALLGVLANTNTTIMMAAETSASTNNVEEQLWDSRGCFDDARGKWFRDAKFGAFIHFGLYSELGGYYKGKGPYDPAEQIMGLGERHMVIPWKVYQDDVGGAFDPTNFNAHKWVSLIKAAGQKYVIVTAKHHDGFAMFRTATTHYNVVDSTPFGRDVIKELADECHRQGIYFCIYYSLGDWTAADVMDPRFKSYHDYMFAQLKELMTHYGKIPLIWFDNYWFVNNQWSTDLPHAKELYAYMRKLNPDVLVNDRCGRGASSTDGDYATPENQLKGSRQSRYFEVVMTDTRDDNWGWVKGATNYRSASEVIHNLIDCTSKGGNFVLNVGPTASGEFPAQHVALLKKVGTWMAVNGEAIYATSPAPECQIENQDDFRCDATQKGRNIYLHVLNWPPAGEPCTVKIARGDFVKAKLLDPKLKDLKLTSAVTGNQTTLTFERPEMVDPYATVIKLVFKTLVTLEPSH
jgi:alpha-L-fucosidase